MYSKNMQETISKKIKEFKNTDLYKLCVFELEFREYILQYPENIFIYNNDILENKKYYDLIIKDRDIIFDEQSMLIKEYYDIDGVFLKLYTNQAFKNLSGSILTLKNLLNSKFLTKIINFKYYILKTPNIKREDILLRISNQMITDILHDLKTISDFACISFTEENQYDILKIINFCSYILEKYYKVLYTFNEKYVNIILNLNLNFFPAGKKNVKSVIDNVLDNAIEYKEKLDKLTSKN